MPLAKCYVVAIHNELLEMMDELLETVQCSDQWMSYWKRGCSNQCSSNVAINVASNVAINELLEMMDELLETCNVAILAKRSSKHTWEQPHAWDDRGFWGCPDSF